MAEWKNVIDNFSEEERHYRDTYMETAEAIEEAAEVDVFSREEGDWEIYIARVRPLYSDVCGFS